VPGLAALSPNVQGAVLMSVSMAGYVLNDTLIKSVAGEVPQQAFRHVAAAGVARAEEEHSGSSHGAQGSGRVR